jgi:hypothetical protein
MQRRDHSVIFPWNHNKVSNQDGTINYLIEREKNFSRIVKNFHMIFPDHKNPEARVRRHIKHLEREHPDFPYYETPIGDFLAKSKNHDNSFK